MKRPDHFTKPQKIYETHRLTVKRHIYMHVNSLYWKEYIHETTKDS